MMKRLLLLITLLYTLIISSQTKQETINYINTKLSKYGVYPPTIKLDNEYLYIYNSEDFKYFERFKIYDVNFKFRVAKHVGEIGGFKIIYRCRDNLKCIYDKNVIYQTIDLIKDKGNNPRDHTYRNNSGVLYFFDEDATKRVFSAFKHLQNITKPEKKKELFGY